MPKSTFSVVECDPVTGHVPNIRTTHGRGLTAVQTVDLLLELTGFDPGKLDGFAVIDESTRLRSHLSSERWMEAHSADHVHLAWTRLSAEQRGHIRQLQPGLGLALDNLEVNHAEAQ